MGFDHTAAKNSITVTLNEDLLRQVKLYTGDLSHTLETLLADFISLQESRERDSDEVIAELIAESVERFDRYGLLSEEFQDF